MDATKGQAGTGVAIKTGSNTTIIVRSASIQLLIGGPYTDVRDEVHTYGHAALRVTTNEQEHVYDFGRYAGEQGPTGQGRLRTWTDFKRYIASQNSYKRVTTGFHYSISNQHAEQINSHFKSQIAGRNPIKIMGQYMLEHRLSGDYHALTNNCVTTSMTGAKLAIPSLEHNVASHNQGRGMSFTERTAARIAGWPGYIFMPEDLQAMLAGNTVKPAEKVEKYGSAQ
ncbi:MAG: hypothetical protein K2X80_16580 [Pseudomonadaceae bacterium]|nr:hypothetical protein [Pseudomonadaceae bacterium]